MRANGADAKKPARGGLGCESNQAIALMQQALEAIYLIALCGKPCGAAALLLWEQRPSKRKPPVGGCGVVKIGLRGAFVPAGAGAAAHGVGSFFLRGLLLRKSMCRTLMPLGLR